MAKRPEANAPRRVTTGVPVAASPQQTGDAKPSAALTEDDAIVQEANERWKAINDWQGVEDQRSREDIKFANADARNNWQWPTKIYERRTSGDEEFPCLTINAVRGHNDLIINQIAKNDWAPKIRPTGGKASYQSAKIYESLIKRILDRSKWPAQRRKISEHQVDGGLGYAIIETGYVSNKTKDQEIYVRSARDPTAVFLDKMIREADGSDANYGFEFERMERKEFNRRYPKWADKVGRSPLGEMLVTWLTDKEVILAKYYRKRQKHDRLWWWTDTGGNETEKLQSDIIKDSGDEIFKALRFDIEQGRLDGDSREVFDDEVQWFLIAGDTIIDRGLWAGKYIPACRCVGRELVIDNTLDRKGHTRLLIDCQRQVNYQTSMQIENIALQPKSPFIAPARAVEGQEQFKTMNILGYPVILYNDVDDEASTELQKIEPPQRLDPPAISSAYQNAIATAERQLMMVSGQWQPQTGEQPIYPESGNAIGKRQQQGDTANYHFFDHQNDMMRLIGVQLLDLIPKIYDTKRVLQVTDDRGEKYWLMIDPQQSDIVKELKDIKHNEEAVKLAFNPCIGEYECVSDPGPDYATQRQEAWEALSMILAQNAQAAAVAADLLFKYGDFPGADELQERFKREIQATKPYLFGNAPDPGLQAVQQQLQKLQQLNGELLQKLAERELRLRGKEELRDIEASRADTDRLKVTLDFLTKVMLTPAQKADLEHQLIMASHQHVYSLVEQANQSAMNGSGTAGQ